MRTSTTGMSNSGFTLLELIIVIFILSLILMISFPTFTLRQNGKLKSEAGRIASIVRYLNDSAILTKETYTLNINFRERVIRYTSPDGERAEKIENLAAVTLQSRGRVSDGEVTMFFGPTGMGENFTIQVSGQESSLEIVFNALSGRVKVVAHERIARTEGIYAS